VVQGSLGHDLAAFDLDDRLGVGDLRDAELLGQLRAHLGGVAVDGLTTAQHDVEGPGLLHGALQGVRGGQRVGAGELAVGQQDHAVGAPEEGFAQDSGRLGRPHRDHGHGAPAPFLDLEGHLQRVQVLGIEDGRQRVAVHGAVFGHHVARDVVRVGHLLDQHGRVDRSLVGHSCPVLRGPPGSSRTGVHEGLPGLSWRSGRRAPQGVSLLRGPHRIPE
jgi:hypothetical protein